MAKDQLQFNQRLQLLTRKHRAMSQGYTTHIQPDGLIIARPRRARPRISLRPVLVFLVAMVAFKGFLIANLGPLAYEERLDRLQQGTVVEQAGAFVMQIDPLSRYAADKIGPVLR